MYNFEKWLKNNGELLCEEARYLFSDSLKCLKNDIDRPAYLLAYQGMMITLREALRKGSAPNGFTEGEWTTRIQETSNEDRWDSAVFDLANQRANPDGLKAAPLHMPPSARNQLIYWRQMRNVCAHYKHEPFTKAHVLSLYSFISFYLLKISVSGGLEDMLDQLKKYCDPSRTPDNQPLQPLIDAAIERIDPNDYDAFISGAHTIVTRAPRKDTVDFFETLLDLTGIQYHHFKEKLIDYINQRTFLLHRLIENNPERLMLFCTTDELKRVFWHTHLLELQRNQLSVVAFMLRAGFIADNDKSELFNNVLTDLYQFDKQFETISYEDVRILTQAGYFDRFVEIYLVTERFNRHPYLSELCHKANFIISHILAMPITESSIEALIDVLGSNRREPYVIAERFRREVLTSTEFHQKLISVAAEHSIDLPENWQNVE